MSLVGHQGERRSPVRTTSATGPPGLVRAWPALVVVPPTVAFATTAAAPDPHGHWVEHASGAGLKAAQLVVLGIVVLLGRRRLPVLVIVAVAVAAVGIALQVYGDTQVARAIWRTPGDPAFGPGYESGHDISARGDLVVLASGLGLAVGAAVTRHLRVSLAVLVGFLAVVPPPFFWPAVGILFAALFTLTRPDPAGEGDDTSGRAASAM